MACTSSWARPSADLWRAIHGQLAAAADGPAVCAQTGVKVVATRTAPSDTRATRERSMDVSHRARTVVPVNVRDFDSGPAAPATPCAETATNRPDRGTVSPAVDAQPGASRRHRD